MDFSALLFFAFGITYIGGLVYVANQVEATRLKPQRANNSAPSQGNFASGMEISQAVVLRWLLYGLVGMMFSAGFVVLQTALFVDMAGGLEGQAQFPLEDIQIDTSAALVVFGLAIVLSFLSFRLINSVRTRERLQGLIGARGSYNPDSPVHTAAVILMLAIVVWTMASFLIQGGISGLAEDLAQQGFDPGDLLFEGTLRVMIVFLGVGLAIRRDWSQTMERLGLRIPTAQDLTRGIGVGLLLILFMIVFGLIWQQTTAPDLLEEQTAANQQLNQLFSSLPMAFLLAITAAVGEEIWIRGALQPVFGILISSLFFMLLHTQVLLTPGTLLILIVSLGLAWVRQTTSTTAAIIAHFVFNFIPLVFLQTVV